MLLKVEFRRVVPRQAGEVLASGSAERRQRTGGPRTRLCSAHPPALCCKNACYLLLTGSVSSKVDTARILPYLSPEPKVALIFYFYFFIFFCDCERQQAPDRTGASQSICQSWQAIAVPRTPSAGKLPNSRATNLPRLSATSRKEAPSPMVDTRAFNPVDMPDTTGNSSSSAMVLAARPVC